MVEVLPEAGVPRLGVAFGHRHELEEPSFTSVGLPSGRPATSRPPVRQFSSAYFSATRMGGLAVGRVAPIGTMATGRSRVSRARMLPIRFGLGMNPYAFGWCS